MKRENRSVFISKTKASSHVLSVRVVIAIKKSLCNSPEQYRHVALLFVAMSFTRRARGTGENKKCIHVCRTINGMQILQLYICGSNGGKRRAKNRYQLLFSFISTFALQVLLFPFNDQEFSGSLVEKRSLLWQFHPQAKANGSIIRDF